MKYNALILSLLTLGLVYSCSPKTTVAEVAEVEEEVVVDPNLSPCKKFSDAFDPDQIEDYFVLYRDDIKNKNYTSAFEYWQQVYKEAPAADGKGIRSLLMEFSSLSALPEEQKTKRPNKSTSTRCLSSMMRWKIATLLEIMPRLEKLLIYSHLILH